MAFWNKDDKLRIDQTVAHICSLAPAMERPTIKVYLDKWMATNFPTSATLKAMSSTLSTKGHAGVGNDATRAERRALALLSGDMINPVNPLHLTTAAAMTMGQAQVTQRLAAIMLPFRIWALQEEKVGTLLQVSLNSLMNQPAAFLANNMIVCQSYGVPPGGAINHKFLYNYKEQNFLMLPAVWNQPGYITGMGLTVSAINVPEIYWANVPGRGSNAAAGNFGGIVSTPLAGASLMVTSAFTGCSFCFKSGAGGAYAAHIGPATPVDPSIGPPPTLATQLAGPHGTGNFASPPGATAGALKVWGRGFSNIAGHPAGYTVNAVPGAPLTAASMYVLGVQTGGTWNFYAQQNVAGARTVTHLV